MSIFPRKTVKGRGVTIHCCICPGPLARPPAVLILEITVTDPAGRCIYAAMRPVLLVASRVEDCARRHLPELAVPVMQGLSADIGGPDAFDAARRIMQEGMHDYLHVPLADSAIPGRYVVCTNLWCDGARHASLTCADDWFLVEELTVEGLDAVAGGRQVCVCNRSAEPVEATIVRYGQTEPIAAPNVFGPAAVTQVDAGSGRAMVIYAEGRAVLPLWRGDAPLLLRSPRYRCFRASHAVAPSVLLVSEHEDRAHEIAGERLVLWNLAGGLATRTEALMHVPGQILDEMLAQGLILEAGEGMLAGFGQDG